MFVKTIILLYWNTKKKRSTRLNTIIQLIFVNAKLKLKILKNTIMSNCSNGLKYNMF